MDDWVFDLNGESKPVDIPSETYKNLSYIGEPKRWEQYSDPFTYEFDRLVRQWFDKMIENKAWVRSRNKRRYTMSMMIEQLYGRKYDVSKDAVNVVKMAKILAYYSTRVQKSGSINNKMYTKTIYTLSPTRYKNVLPYSLKLRLEIFAEQGIIPDYHNMTLPRDNLKPGHARNPKTDANMERKREEGRRKYNERYKNRHSTDKDV